MSSAHEDSAGSPQSAAQALTRLSTADDSKRANSNTRHRHTHSLGLLSPTASFTSFTSLISPSPQSEESSYFSSTSSQHHILEAPSRPRTPLRSPSTPKPRPSPLVQRLLQPFARSSAPTSPTTSTSPLPLHTMAALHHPIPQAYQPPSPTSSTNPQRPPSRSERLLRDALLRDEMERHGAPPMSHSPLATSSTTPGSPPPAKSHKRRHSHVPTSATSPVRRTEVSPSPERRLGHSEEYTRGSYLFRTAMSNPRSLSPASNTGGKYYGGDAEGSPTGATPQHHRHQTHHHHHQRQELPQPQQQPSTPSTRSRSHATQSPPARSTSHSPSPLRKRTQAEHRPSPLPMDSTAAPPSSPHVGLQRYNTVRSQSGTRGAAPESPSGTGTIPGTTTTTSTGAKQRVRSRPPPIDLFSQPKPASTSSPQPPPSRGQPQTQTPSRQQAQPQQQQAYTSPGEPLMMTPHEQVLRARLERVLEVGRVVERGEKERDRQRRDRGRSESRSNEVRDEEGGWPWRESFRVDKGKESAGSESLTSSGLYSSPSNSSGGSQPYPNVLVQPATSRTPSKTQTQTETHNRTRSKTDPVSPPPGTPSHLQARRSSTAPSAAGTPTRKPQSQSGPRTGTTPPLVPDSAAATQLGFAADGEGEDGDLRLLTPPPTPPFTARMFSFSSGGHVHARGASLGGDYVPSPYKTSHPPKAPLPSTRAGAGRKAAFGLGAPRRPLHPPRHSSSSEHDDLDSESCSSQASFPSSRSGGSCDSHAPSLPPNSPPMNPHGSSRPQFNARTASARCREIEGYVSFASVEGLGEPPADPLSPDGGEGEDGEQRGRGRGKGEKGVFGVALGGWRRLLAVAGAGVQGHGEAEEGGVVL